MTDALLILALVHPPSGHRSPIAAYVVLAAALVFVGGSFARRAFKARRR